MLELPKEYMGSFDLFRVYGEFGFKSHRAIRRKLEDDIHIAVRQYLLFSILSLDPAMYAPYIYSWGKFIGYVTAEHAIKAKGVQVITRIISSLLHLRLLKMSLYKKMVYQGWLGHKAALMNVADVNIKENSIKIIGKESIDSAGIKGVKKNICIYHTAVLAGNISYAIGKDVNFSEKACAVNGSKNVFVGQVNGQFPKFDVLTKKEIEKIKRCIIDNIYLNKDVRPTLGNFMHLTAFQMFYLGLWFSSPGAHTMLYWIGRQFGEDLYKRMGIKSIDKLARILEYLRIGVLEWTGARTIKVEECALCIGAKNIQKKICSYLAGLIDGFLGKHAIETSCVANGDNYCEFTLF